MRPNVSAAELTPPLGSGTITGPAGALLSHAWRWGLDALGLVVETDSRFPDPQGARPHQGGHRPAGVDVDTDPLVERAEQIIERRKELVRRMQEADRHESSRASSVDMY